MNELLDDEIKDEVMRFKVGKVLVELIPFFVVLGLLIYTLIRVSFSVEYLDIIDYVMYGLVGCSAGWYFVARKVYIYSLVLIFILGMFNFFTWIPYVYTFGFGVNDYFIRFQPLSLFLLVIHLIIFRKESLNLVKRSEDYENENSNREGIERLKKKFERKSKEELEIIVESKSYREEAKIAAKELLEVINE